jgi:ROS/MUCR transcriptional regulator protein
MSLSMLPYGYIAGKQPLITGVALEALRQDPRRAIAEDHVVCLVCGAVFRHLTNTHLVHHSMTSADYKQSFGYNGRRAVHRGRRRSLGDRVAIREACIAAPSAGEAQPSGSSGR